MQQKTYKYRINEELLKMPIKDFRKALKVIPTECNISEATFNNYRAIQIGDKQDIPHSVVDKLEKLFSLKSGELQNYTNDDIRPISERTEGLDDIASQLGLKKS